MGFKLTGACAFLSSIWTCIYVWFHLVTFFLEKSSLISLTLVLPIQKKRFSLLLLFGVLKGASVGPCIKSTIDVDYRCNFTCVSNSKPIKNGCIDLYIYVFIYCFLAFNLIVSKTNMTLVSFSHVSSILITAFLGTSVVFFCFSAVAMLARRREYLYLGGLLSSGFSLLAWIKTSEFASSTVEIQVTNHLICK